MYLCPECGSDQIAGRERCLCGADLRVLRDLTALQDAWFNAGAGALEAGRHGEAVEWFAACAVARPTEVEPLELLARSWLLLGRPAEAARVLDRADELGPPGEARSALRSQIAEASQRIPAAGNPEPVQQLN